MNRDKVILPACEEVHNFSKHEDFNDFVEDLEIYLGFSLTEEDTDWIFNNFDPVSVSALDAYPTEYEDED